MSSIDVAGNFFTRMDARDTNGALALVTSARRLRPLSRSNPELLPHQRRSSHRSALHRPQRAQRRLLRLGQALHPADIEALVGAVAPQRPQMLATLEIPDLDGPVIAATGEPLAIGTHAERLDCPLMPLPKGQALPALHVPPVHAPIAAATE